MLLRISTLAGAALLALAGTAGAVDIDTGDSDYKVRLDLTPKYSLGYRLHNPSQALVGFNPAVDPGTINEDDGDNNFRRGLMSNRLDLLAELDVTGTHFGARISGNAWYDRVYTRTNDNRPTQVVGAPPGVTVETANTFAGAPTNAFLPATRRQMGEGTQILDAFVYLKGDIGDMKGTLRVGRHTLQWGESLFFGQNGIANAQVAVQGSAAAGAAGVGIVAGGRGPVVGCVLPAALGAEQDPGRRQLFLEPGLRGHRHRQLRRRCQRKSGHADL
jgi:hypothetical protein